MPVFGVPRGGNTMKYLFVAAALAALATPALAWDSNQGGEAFGTGTDEGPSRLIAHQAGTTLANQLKSGGNLTSSSIYAIGVQNIITVDGDDNEVGGNDMNGEVDDSTVSTDGEINN